MIKITGGVPLKTRLPLAAWVIAGLVTLFSMASSVVHVAPAPNQPHSLSVEAAVQVHQASVGW
jgi:hypothetical protein